MSITKINLDESTNLQFEVSIEGVRDKVSEIRFVVEAEGYKVGFNGSLKDGTLSIDLPILEGIVGAGTKRCFLEVVADSKYFVPLDDTIEFVAPIRVESVMVEKTETVPEIKVSAAQTKVKTAPVNVNETFEDVCAKKKLKIVESVQYVFAKDSDDQYVRTIS